MAQSPLLLIGAGGFARETIELVRAVNHEAPTWDLVGLLDDDPELRENRVHDVPILGHSATASEHPEALVAACVASPVDPLRRLRLTARLDLPLERYATLIHPRAVIAETAAIGPGSVVHANAVLTSDVHLGVHVAVMPSTILTHDDVVEDGVTFGSGAKISGGVTIERGAYIGAGALLREKIAIGSGAVVGMGSVVTRSVPPGDTWHGSPARPIASGDKLEVVR
jgi:sugar O-acyltransferase (sialic acid O-acetyltransferase NeuD family)